MAAERPAAGGEHDAARLRSRRPACRAWKMALCSLSTGRMRGAVSAASSMTSGPAIDQRFLVGQGDGLAGFQGRPGAPQPRTAHDRRHHHVDLAAGDRFDQALRGRPAARTSAGRLRPVDCRPAASAIGDDQPARPDWRAWSDSSSALRVGREGHGPQSPSRRRDDFQRAAPMLPVEPRRRRWSWMPAGQFERCRNRHRC